MKKYKIDFPQMKARMNNYFGSMQYQKWKTPYSLLGDSISHQAASDKEKKNFNISYVDDLRKEMKEVRSMTQKLWLINTTLVIMLVLAFHDVRPDASIVNMKISNIEKFSEIILVVSSSILVVYIYYSIKNVVLNDVIEKILRQIITKSQFNAYYTKYSDPPIFAANLAFTAIKEKKNLVKDRGLTKLLHNAATIFLLISPFLYSIFYIVLVVSAHADAIINTYAAPNISLFLNRASLAYVVFTDLLCFLCTAFMFIPRQYKDEELLDIMLRHQSNGTLRKLKLAAHFKKRKKDYHSRSKVP